MEQRDDTLNSARGTDTDSEYTVLGELYSDFDAIFAHSDSSDEKFYFYALTNVNKCKGWALLLILFLLIFLLKLLA